MSASRPTSRHTSVVVVPPQGGGHDPATRPRPPFRGVLTWRPDAVSLLSLVVFFTFVLPAEYVLPALGAVGTPTNLLGIVALCAWAFGRIRPAHARLPFQPVRIIVGVYLFVMLLTYAGGFLRGMFPDELRNATRFIIETIALTGVALLAADGINDRRRLRLLLQRVVYGAAFMGFAGDLEFFTKFNLADHMRFPGLVVNSQVIGLRLRGDGFTRVAGTASHYIEFGVVLAMLLPLAIQFAMFAPTRGRRQLNWLLVAMMAAGVPFSLSRSAALGLIVGLFIVAACWTWRTRLNAIVVAMVGAVAMKAVKPGLLGTIRSLFTNFGNDPSISGRTSDYGPSFAYIGQRPVFGRGAGTFIPSRYRYLDNQVLMTTIESGVVGLVALALLFLGGAALAHRVGKFAGDPETKHLGYALLAAIGVAFVTAFTFDAFSFPIYSTMLFLTLGVSGALWRIDRDARHAHITVDKLAKEATLDRRELTSSGSS